MTYSPVYRHFMTELVKIIIAKGLMVGFNAVDNNQLVLIALCLGQDRESREMIEDRLGDSGDLVQAVWRSFCRAVNEHNAEGVATTSLDIHKLIQGAIDANRG